jgi:tyrosine-protein kinase Etk/Wzc
MPGGPISPQKQIGALIGGIMGLILGICLAFLIETLDTSIRTIEDVESFVKLPVLGVVPSIPSNLEDGKSIVTKVKRKILLVRKSEAEEAYIRSIVHHKPKSPMAEAYRNLRTNLKISPSQRVFLVTSAGPREGKTTILTNLGLAVAQKGLKVLLVSSDLRRPALAKTFGLKKEPGLTEAMLGTVKLNDALRSISDIMLGDMELDEIMKTPGIENLWILPSGHLPHNPAEFLESKELPELVEELKARFDVIFFDSPPILLVTDACLLVSKVDSVVLCYEIGRTARDVLLRAKVQLESVDAKISGVVLNHISPETEAMATYPYYYNYKYYGTKVKQEA